MINFKPRADESVQPAETNDKILFLDTDGDLKIKDDSSVVTTVATTTDVAAARPYKVYTALLTQSGTNAPVATVLENTLGGTVVWSYSSVGSYLGTLNGAFTVNKTFGVVCLSSEDNYSVSLVNIGTNLSANLVVLGTNDGENPANNVLNKANIEIRVYP